MSKFRPYSPALYGIFHFARVIQSWVAVWQCAKRRGVVNLNQLVTGLPPRRPLFNDNVTKVGLWWCDIVVRAFLYLKTCKRYLMHEKRLFLQFGCACVLRAIMLRRSTCCVGATWRWLDSLLTFFTINTKLLIVPFVQSLYSRLLALTLPYEIILTTLFLWKKPADFYSNRMWPAHLVHKSNTCFGINLFFI